MELIMNDTATHEWVLDFNEYEAVLVCNNELREWNTDSIIRAFQTFQFRDTSDVDDEIELTHIDGGSIIQYDGNVLAIRYSESFVVMLRDLVMALSSLGWKSASAYHNAESIALFMEDMGRAIPASVDFDVIPAGRDSHAVNYPLGHAMLSDTRGPGLNAKEQLDVLAQEFNSLDSPASGDISSLKPTSPIILLEDPAFAGMLMDTVSVNISRPQGPQHAFQAEMDEPLVFQLPDQHNDEPDISPIIDTTAPAHNVIAIDSVKRSRPLDPKKPGNSNIIQLGKGYLLFDLPGAPLSDASINAVLGEEFNDASQYVHLYPGKLNNSLHWDLLGEIPADNPQFADTLVRFMGLNGHDRALLAALLASAAGPSANWDTDFRMVLNFIILKCSHGNEAESASFGFYAENISSTATSLLLHSDYTGTKNALLKYTGQMALIPNLACFLDMKHPTKEDPLPAFDSFILRDLAKQDESWVYFIHCSKDDTILARWITMLLYNLSLHLKFTEKSV
jgi:hypothetical protein